MKIAKKNMITKYKDFSDISVISRVCEGKLKMI